MGTATEALGPDLVSPGPSVYHLDLRAQESSGAGGLCSENLECLCLRTQQIASL